MNTGDTSDTVMNTGDTSDAFMNTGDTGDTFMNTGDTSDTFMNTGDTSDTFMNTGDTCDTFMSTCYHVTRVIPSDTFMYHDDGFPARRQEGFSGLFRRRAWVGFTLLRRIHEYR